MAKSERGLGRLGSSIQLGANLENSRYKNQAALPNQHENDAQLFADLGKSFSAPGDRPRGILRNLGAGIAKGLEYGAKSKAIDERKGNYDEYANVMNYFQEVNNAAIEQNQWYENRERQLETIKPFAIGGLEVSYSGMDYGTGNERMRNIMEQAKLADPSIKGDYVGYIPNTPIVNLRDADGNITAFSLSSIVGEDVVKRVQGNYIDQQKISSDMNYKQDDLDLKKFEKGIPGGKYGVQDASSDSVFEHNGNAYDVVPLRGLEKTEKSDYGKMVNKAVSQISTNENALKAINTMRGVFERNPHIGESYVNMLSSGADEDTWSRYIAKKFTSRQERADMEILKKNTNDLNLSTVLSVPGKSATDLLKQAIQAASPTGTLTKQAFDKVAGEWEERAIHNIDMAKAQAHARAQGKMIVSRNSASNNPGVVESDIWDQLEQ